MQWGVSWNCQQGNCSLGMLGTEHICPAALMRKWTHASGHPGPRPSSGQPYCLPQGMASDSQALARTHRTILLKCFSFLTAWAEWLISNPSFILVYFMSLVFTALLCTFFPKSLSVCIAGLLSLAPAVWSEQGRVVGAGRQQQLRGSSHTTTFYTSHLFEMPTIRRIKSVLHASQQQ